MNKRLLRILMLLVVVSAVGAILLYVLTPREPALLKRAAMEADSHSWNAQQTGLHWINDREVLFVRPNISSRQGLRFYKYDIKAKEETFLEALTQLPQNTSNPNLFSIGISPDGTRLFCSDSWAHNGIWGATFEGKQSFDIKQKELVRVSWMGDSRHLIAYTVDMKSMGNHPLTSGEIYDTQTNRSVRNLKVPPSTQVDQVAANNHLLAMTGADEQYFDPVTDCVDIHEVEVGKETQPIRKYRIHLPFKSQILAWKFSLQGDHIGWLLLQDDYLPPISTWIQRLIPAYQPQRTPKVSLWVSRLDGSLMHEIGFLPIRFDQQRYATAEEDEPECLDWLPDGKRLSFQYKDALYTVPSD